MNLMKLYFTVAAIIVVAICSDAIFPDSANSTAMLPVPRADKSLAHLTHYRE
ncbi:MAG: hypothetical protein ACKVQT_09260 [Burkholderiales bacterium]